MTLCKKGQHILAAEEGGLAVLDSTNGETLKLLKLGHHAFAVQYYNDTIIAAVGDEKHIRTEVVTLDSDYNEIARWAVRPGSCDCIAVDEKVLLTGMSEVSGNIRVFSLTGEELSSISWSGSPVGITSISPSSIVFGDDKQHAIIKKRAAYSLETEWSTEVTAPHGLSVDENGLIWVHSNRNDSLTILQKDGKQCMCIRYGYGHIGGRSNT